MGFDDYALLIVAALILAVLGSGMLWSLRHDRHHRHFDQAAYAQERRIIALVCVGIAGLFFLGIAVQVLYG